MFNNNCIICLETIRTKTVLPTMWPQIEMAEMENVISIVTESITSDLISTWQYNRRQGLYEESNILCQTRKISKPKPVFLLWLKDNYFHLAFFLKMSFSFFCQWESDAVHNPENSFLACGNSPSILVKIQQKKLQFHYGSR